MKQHIAVVLRSRSPDAGPIHALGDLQRVMGAAEALGEGNLGAIRSPKRQMERRGRCGGQHRRTRPAPSGDGPPAAVSVSEGLVRAPNESAAGRPGLGACPGVLVFVVRLQAWGRPGC